MSILKNISYNGNNIFIQTHVCTELQSNQYQELFTKYNCINMNISAVMLNKYSLNLYK